jgi:hypothetical protein
LQSRIKGAGRCPGAPRPQGALARDQNEKKKEEKVEKLKIRVSRRWVIVEIFEQDALC